MGEGVREREDSDPALVSSCPALPDLPRLLPLCASANTVCLSETGREEAASLRAVEEPALTLFALRWWTCTEGL